MIYKE
ncbi:3e4c54cb-9f8f-49de-82b0-080b2baa39f1 [Thermothielavioides terrestris]